MAMNIRIGERTIGDGAPCFIIAEAGSNHNGRLEQALRLIEVAAEAGADAVKFQLFRADRLYPKGAGASDYLKIDRSIYDIIEEMEMPYDWLPRLAGYCRQKQILFLCSVFDEESVDRLDPFVPAHKVASYEMTHLPLVQAIARKGKPVFVSTGTANFEEVGETVQAFRETGNESLALMQCTGAYPAPLDALNLRALVQLKSAFHVPAGLSDHSRDPWVAPMAAAALGANLLEKHFTLSNRLPGPDHAFAVEPEELRQMIQKVREVEQALGTGEKRVQEAEQEMRRFARRSIYAVKNIQAGETLTKENMAVLRSGKLSEGLPPKEYPSVMGRRARRAIRTDSPILLDDLA